MGVRAREPSHRSRLPASRSLPRGGARSTSRIPSLGGGVPTPRERARRGRRPTCAAPPRIVTARVQLATEINQPAPTSSRGPALTWLSSFLPGARDARTPLAAGLLWALFTWLLVADAIPAPEAASGWTEQVYALASAAGPLLTLGTALTLMFLAGALAVSMTDVIASLVGILLRRISRAFAWQTHARRQI